jgi:hypothetical protein
LRRHSAFAAATSSEMQVGIMLAIRKSGSRRLASGNAESEAAMCERLALAKMTPCEISPASATMRFLSAARTIGGSGPKF